MSRKPALDPSPAQPARVTIDTENGESPTDIKDRLASVGIEPLLSIDDWAAILRVSRRAVERMRAAGLLPLPDLCVGRLPRWRPATARRYLDAQDRGKGARR